MNVSYSTGPIDSSFWDSLFNADSITVIGARDVVGSWGYDALKAAQDSPSEKIPRRVYAVNPSADEVLGVPAYDTILDIPDPVQLAFIVVPASVVPLVLRQCAEKQVKAAVIVSAGFSEVGEKGAELEAEIVTIAGQAGIRFVGPNCIGHADLHSRLHSAHFAGSIKPGPLALLSQSGTLGATIMQVTASMGIGLSKFVSTGNEASLHLEDYLEYLGRDQDTKIIAAYIEGLREGRRFFQLAKEITLTKPVIAIKSGATGGAGKAARSHTGALAGSDAVYTAAFKQAGVIRVEDEVELGNLVVALLNQPLPGGNRVAILTMGGGFGVVASEACEKEGLSITSLEPKTLEKLNGILPPRWSHGNPVDMVGIRPGEGDDTTVNCLRFLMQDRNVDGVISLLPPMVTTHGRFEDITPERYRKIRLENLKNLDVLAQELKRYNKPFLMVRMFTPLAPSGAEEPFYKPKVRIPEYSNPRRVARVMRLLAWYRRYLDDRNMPNPLA